MFLVCMMLPILAVSIVLSWVSDMVLLLAAANDNVASDNNLICILFNFHSQTVIERGIRCKRKVNRVQKREPAAVI